MEGSERKQYQVLDYNIDNNYFLKNFLLYRFYSIGSTLQLSWHNNLYEESICLCDAAAIFGQRDRISYR